ncbi:MAG: PAS domain S-box protein [Pyrinomonadaceae bacterium]
MSQKSLKILFVYDPAASRSEIRELLLKTDMVQFELDYVPTGLAGISFRPNYYNVCIIDSASAGLGLLEKSRRLGFTTPIIMLISDSAYEVRNAVRHGAADCLIREALSAGALEESICIVMERARYREYQSECARRYLGLVDNSSEIIYAHDLEGNSTFISKAGEQLFGYTRDEIFNINFGQIIAPECLDIVWRNVAHMLANRKQCSYEAVMLNKKGKRIPVSVTMHLIYKEGSPIGVQGIARALSCQIPAALALRDSEQRAGKLF